MRKAPKVMPSTAASPSPRSAAGGHTHEAVSTVTPSQSLCTAPPNPAPCPKLTVGRPPDVLHCHLQNLLEDGVVLRTGRAGVSTGTALSHRHRPSATLPWGQGWVPPHPAALGTWGAVPSLVTETGGWGPTETGTGTAPAWGHAWGPRDRAVTDLQPGLALEGGGEGDVAALGDGIGEAESPNLPGPAAGGLLQHGHAGALRLVGLHQQQRLRPRCHQPALLELQVGRVVVPAHGRLWGGGRGHREGCRPVAQSPRCPGAAVPARKPPC